MGAFCGVYELLEPLSVGGMAELHKARRPGSDETVVIKRLLPQYATDPTVNAMFVDEARVTGSLSHPGIVRVLELGKHEQQLYLVMEYLEGADLRELMEALLAQRRRFRNEVAVWIICEVLKALAFAHEQRSVIGLPLGIVHRDVSPANILVGRDGGVKLADFGVARARDLDHVTHPGEVRGKYGYMAPEQVSSQPVDARTDLFSAGVVLAELLTARRVFLAPDPVDQMMMIRNGDLSRFERTSHKLPADLRAIVRRAMHRDPDARYDSAAEMRAALQAWLADQPHPVDAAWLAAVLEDCWTTILHGRKHRQPGANDTQEIDLDADVELEVTSAAPPAPADEEFDDDELIVAGQEPPRAAASGARIAATELAERWGLGDRTSPATMLEQPRFQLPELLPERRGDLARSPLPAVLAGLTEQRASGLLVLSFGAVEKHIYVIDGRPGYVESNQPGERFGDYLAAVGALAPAAAARAVAEAGDGDRRLFDWLVVRGQLSAADGLRHLTAMTHAMLVDACLWAEGKWSWYRADVGGMASFPIDVDLGNVLATAATRLGDGRLRDWLQRSGATCLCPRAIAGLDLTGRRIGTVDVGALHRQLDGIRSVRAVAADGADAAEVEARQRALYLLWATGLAVDPLVQPQSR